jgi:hypothetical protein
MTPVVSRRVSTKRIVRFANGNILLRVLLIELWLVYTKKNLLPFSTSLSTHMLPYMRDTRRFEMESQSLVLVKNYVG